MPKEWISYLALFECRVVRTDVDGLEVAVFYDKDSRMLVIFHKPLGYPDANDKYVQPRPGGKEVKGKALLRVVEQAFDNGWKTAGEIVVERDGSYQWTINDLSKSSRTLEIFKGRLPDSLMRSLQEDVSKKAGVEIVDGVPTYRYGIDDHRARHPAGIGKLLTSLAETHKPGFTISVGDRLSAVIRNLEDSGAKKVWMATAPPDPPAISEDYELPSGGTIGLGFVPSGEKESQHIYILKGIEVCRSPDQPLAARKFESVKQLKIPPRRAEGK
jgi:hypothetical protein